MGNNVQGAASPGKSPRKLSPRRDLSPPGSAERESSSSPRRSPKRKARTKGIQCVVLGTAGSGKTTFTRQMRVIHGIDFTPVEVENFKSIIRGNIISGIHELTLQAERNELEEINTRYSRHLEIAVRESSNDWNELWKDDKWAVKLKSLWADNAIRQTWRNGSSAALSNLPYLMAKIDEIALESYVPTNEDIFHARQRTAGTASVEFVAENYVWCLKDVGGQPSERKAWPDILTTGLHSLMFFVALDEYDVPGSTPGQTKMEDSINAWKDLFELPIVRSACVLLFLNKVDLFTEKYNKSQKTFEEVFQKAEDVDDAIEIVGEHYLGKCPEPFRAPGKVLVLPITALDTKLITSVFKQIRSHVILSVLASVGMF